MIELMPRPEMNGLKDDINQFISLLNKDKTLPDEKELKYISKGILFQKNFFIINSKHNIHYKNFMIYDLLLMMHTLTQNSVLNFYNAYRSYIENFIRSFLDIKDNDETGVNALFKMFKEKTKDNQNMKEVADFIDGEYSKSCDYIHSNIRAKMKIHLYYMDIVKSDEMNDAKISKFIGMVKTLLVMTNRLVLIMFPLKVEAIYYRKYEELEYLIGSKMFKKYKPNKIDSCK
ncbi:MULTISPECIES: hypothetical protein [unclassified Clostridium]|uniref:hypothetical protein n=1 Tax=unclassified Clostridium TaxID=2614128 RepID=UPI003217C3FB